MGNSVLLRDNERCPSSASSAIAPQPSATCSSNTSSLPHSAVRTILPDCGCAAERTIAEGRAQAKRAALFAEHLVEGVLSEVPHCHVVFTVPKVVRGLFERERRLLSIFPRCVHEAVQRVLREAVGDRRARVGTVASIQTFGSFAANFHPHVHALVTEGAFHVAPAGKHVAFERLPWWDQHALSEMFRRLVLRELRRAERLREEIESMLLSWQHSGFHVHAGEPVLADDTDRLEHLARTIIHAPIRLDAITPLEAARVVVCTPPDPQTGSQRLLRKIFEVDPLLCPQCPNINPVEMRVVSVIQAPTVIDGILAHLQKIGGNDPHEGTAQRGPPVR